MKTLFEKAILIFCLVSCMINRGFCQNQIGDEIRQLMAEYKAVGLSVAVVNKGDIIFAEAFGKKNMEKGEDLAINHLFRIASISKSFSATAVMQLVEKGKLKLSDDVSGLIGFSVRHPNYPETPITLEMLLSHTSSLNDSQGYFNLDVIDPATNALASKCYNSYRPGTDYQYCNLNFNMVGTIIERVSGLRFDEYIRKNILEPLGLYGGYCVDSLDQNRLAMIYEYNKKTGEFVVQPDAYHPRREILASYQMGRSTPVFSPTGGMKINAPDLAKYMTMHANYGTYQRQRIIKKKNSKRMQTPVPNANGYGLGLTQMEKLIPGKLLKGHTGSAYGLHSIMVFEPREKWGIVAITNGSNPVYTDGRNEFLAKVTELLYRRLVEK